MLVADDEGFCAHAHILLEKAETDKPIGNDEVGHYGHTNSVKDPLEDR